MSTAPVTNIHNYPSPPPTGFSGTLLCQVALFAASVGFAGGSLFSGFVGVEPPKPQLQTREALPQNPQAQPTAVPVAPVSATPAVN